MNININKIKIEKLKRVQSYPIYIADILYENEYFFSMYLGANIINRYLLYQDLQEQASLNQDSLKDITSNIREVINILFLSSKIEKGECYYIGTHDNEDYIQINKTKAKILGTDFKDIMSNIEYQRDVLPLILDRINKYNKIIRILGARQVGKTYILNYIKKHLPDKKILYINCDNSDERILIDTDSLSEITFNIKGSDVLLIDEVQRLKDPGLTLKIIFDNMPNVKIIATGSSSFFISQKTTDSLVGRFFDFYIKPLSLEEIVTDNNKISFKNKVSKILPQLLIYGSYPEILKEPSFDMKKEYLKNIVESYIFEDINILSETKNINIVPNLAKALAYQIGSIVSEEELANKLHVNRKTISNYINMLEKTFIITRIYPYYGNKRREISAKYKVYFQDLGIRNSLIGDFNNIDLRKDNGYIWENFLVIERQKRLNNQHKDFSFNFWRTYDGAEIDYIEKINNKEKAFEFKYSNKKTRSKGAKSFKDEYKIDVKFINGENFTDFILS